MIKCEMKLNQLNESIEIKLHTKMLWNYCMEYHTKHGKEPDSIQIVLCDKSEDTRGKNRILFNGIPLEFSLIKE